MLEAAQSTASRALEQSSAAADSESDLPLRSLEPAGLDAQGLVCGDSISVGDSITVRAKFVSE